MVFRTTVEHSRHCIVTCARNTSQRLPNGCNTSKALTPNSNCVSPIMKRLTKNPSKKLSHLNRQRPVHPWKCAPTVTECSRHKLLCWFTNELTPEKSHIFVNTALKDSMWRAIYWGIWGRFMTNSFIPLIWTKKTKNQRTIEKIVFFFEFIWQTSGTEWNCYVISYYIFVYCTLLHFTFK